jgi:ribose-phosphate pyrophosphokinase
MSSDTIELLPGSAHAALGDAVARELGVAPVPRWLERTPDGELLVRVDERVRGRSVALVQPTAAPVGEHLLELLLLEDACWRIGARGTTAVMPYLGYSRQDRRTRNGEPLGARVLAAALSASHLGRLIVVDPHQAAVEAGFACPVEMLTAVPLLARAVERHLGDDFVVVAPDLGATKLAQRYAQLLGRPMAIVHKERLGPGEVLAHRIIGEVRGLIPVLVDDMISTAGTVAAALELLLRHGARSPAVVVATHGLFAPPAPDRLRALPIARVHTTDSVPPPSAPPFTHEVTSLAPLLGEAIRNLAADGVDRRLLSVAPDEARHDG